MLFNSLQFIFLFLPLTLVGYYLMLRLRMQRWIFVYLVAASLVFYSVWNPRYTLLLLASVGGNYLVGNLIAMLRERGRGANAALALGVFGNLAVLGWYKYSNFVLDNVSALTGVEFTFGAILLPLAISFYTFQQIAYLVDVARGEVKPGGVWRYATFVIFFPQLIAGPIVHYREMMPQFFGRKLGRFAGASLSIGLTIFAIGLFKKTVIADSAALFASPIFADAHQGNTIGFMAAWQAAICYTIQLYFDFSGYSDMAIGLARMFGIKLPPNFHSPLRAASIIEYWRRWHITLQQFIVAYMYQPILTPLARWGAERGLSKWPMFYVATAFPTVGIFILIGLWHGAGWTYVLFGLMHGTYLAINEGWRLYRRKVRRKSSPQLWHLSGYHILTLLGVVFANVMFRAEAVGDALRIWSGMVRFQEISYLTTIVPMTTAELITKPFAFVALTIVLVAFFPNTQQLMGRYSPVLNWTKWREIATPLVVLHWRPGVTGAVFTGLVLFLGVVFLSRGQSEFIYFNF